MKTIEVIIADDGGISTYERVDEYTYNKVDFDKYRNTLEEVFNECGNRIIVSTKYDDKGTIKFKNDNIEFKIIHFMNNKEKKSNNTKDRMNYYDLQNVIDKSKFKFSRIKRKKEKARKVKRIKTFVAVGFVSIGIATSILGLANNSKTNDNIYIDDYIVNNYEYNNDTIDTKNLYIDEKEELDELTNTEYLVNNQGSICNYDISFNDIMDKVYKDSIINAKNNYNDIITSIANEYGIDPQIMIAIAAQESGGIHSTRDDRAAMGLMQIQRSTWNGHDVTAFNHKTNSKETLHITDEKLKDVEFNIRVACMIFQNCLDYSNYNLELAIQMYNFGYGNVEKVIKTCYGDNMTIKELSNNYDDNWLDYRIIIPENVGDKKYLEKIAYYIEDPSNINIVDNEGSIRSYEFNNITKKL